MATMWIEQPRRDGKYPVLFAYENGVKLNKLLSEAKMQEHRDSGKYKVMDKNRYGNPSDVPTEKDAWLAGRQWILGKLNGKDLFSKGGHNPAYNWISKYSKGDYAAVLITHNSRSPKYELAKKLEDEFYRGGESMTEEDGIRRNEYDVDDRKPLKAAKVQHTVEEARYGVKQGNSGRNRGNTGRRKGNLSRLGNNAHSSLAEAEDLAERFHGRPPKEIVDLVGEHEEPENLATLGELIELKILVDKGKAELPIRFDRTPEKKLVYLAADGEGTQLYLVGGDQSLDLDKVEDQTGCIEVQGRKRFICVGQISAIAYFADKHHLEGPSYQKQGADYEHQFGELEGGELPWLMYDTLNRELQIVGGSYTIEDEGINN